MRIIAVTNQKGGVGKTTCVLNIGAGLVRLQQKVLLVDLDPQAHLTESLGISSYDLDLSIYNLLKGDVSFSEVAQERQGLTILPSSLDLSGADFEFAAITGRELLLKEALGEVDGFDYVFLDCPPNLGILTVNALVAAQEVYIPLQTEFLALKGLTKLLETVAIVKKRLNEELEITGIIGTRFDKRKRLNREVVAKISEHFGDKVFQTLIRDNIALAEAPSHSQDILTYSPASYGAEDYLNLCREIIARS
jgi:chromosome partitioning protein